MTYSKKTGHWPFWGIVAAVLVLGGAAVAIVAIANKSATPENEPRHLAQEYIDAVNKQQPAKLSTLACTALSAESATSAVAAFRKQGAYVSVVGEAGEAGENQAAYWVDFARRDPEDGERGHHRYRLTVSHLDQRGCVDLTTAALPG